MPPDSGPASVDAVVIGAGHNGLVAAAVLADTGWDVLVLEAQPGPGGAVRSAELIPGYVSDFYSAFYPMSMVFPVIHALHHIRGLPRRRLNQTVISLLVRKPSSAGVGVIASRVSRSRRLLL